MQIAQRHFLHHYYRLHAKAKSAFEKHLGHRAFANQADPLQSPHSRNCAMLFALIQQKVLMHQIAANTYQRCCCHTTHRYQLYTVDTKENAGLGRSYGLGQYQNGQ